MFCVLFSALQGIEYCLELIGTRANADEVKDPLEDHQHNAGNLPDRALPET
jgi:hypothetical protein